ncbi:HutD family protein [Hydrogenophaga sp.]|uniref:HutD/Ves family protein n=1 Tax=Hydrogenophaga sp. TaxID=1904254 RepID=UPI00286D6B65|nr:HutD family protein [Hydrogenophaga sp.]
MSHQPSGLRVDAVPGALWRNSGGVTRELLRWPGGGDDWRLRISVADIATDGPFSVFEGVQRWITLLSGEGLALDFAGRPQTLRPGDAPLAFDGGAPPVGRLLGGPVRDLNLMVRGGSGGMTAMADDVPWSAPRGAHAGLFARVAGRWSGAGDTRTLAAQSLLWFEEPPAGPWRFEPFAMHPAAAAPVGWWLHHLPVGPST